MACKRQPLQTAKLNCNDNNQRNKKKNQQHCVQIQIKAMSGAIRYKIAGSVSVQIQFDRVHILF